MVAAKESDAGKGDAGIDRSPRKLPVDSSESSSSSSTTLASSDSGSSSSASDDEVVDPGDLTKTVPEAEKIVKKPVAGRRPLTGKVTQSKCGLIRKRKRKERPITICLTNCRYEVVKNVGRRHGLQEVQEDEGWNIYWTDFSVSLERAMDMRRFQIVNHFPGMNEICRKDLLCRNLNRMKRLFPTDYDIYPKTWSLPTDLGELQTYAHTRKTKTYICKPEMGCQGRGIFLIRNIKDLNPFGKIICQLYIAKVIREKLQKRKYKANPFLIDNFKFDLRIYVLITSVDPLRVYVYKEGLARFATAKYKPPTNSNTENSYMHLTNYAVNKYSRDYVVDDEGGSKRKLTAVYRWLEDRGHDVPSIVDAIDEVMLKTILSAQPVLKHNYRTCFPNHDICSACFEILGFDILLDQKLKPFVLEVNHSPSFHTDTKLDEEIKEGLLQDTFAMLNTKKLEKRKIESIDRKRVQDRLLQKQGLPKKDGEKSASFQAIMDTQFAHEMEQSGGYRLIYPTPDSAKYDQFMEQNFCSLYQETAASQARANCTRTQLEEYNLKKLDEERKRSGLRDLSLNIKDKVRPESPLERSGSKLSTYELGGTFAPTTIINEEEVERAKGLMQRGMLIRSLGIELQAFKLLCQLGTLKPEEEKVFRRMHGMNCVEWENGEPYHDGPYPFKLPGGDFDQGQGDTMHCPSPRTDFEADLEYQSLSSWRRNLANSCSTSDGVEQYQFQPQPPLPNSKMAGRYSIQNYNVQTTAPILMTNPLNVTRVNALPNNPTRQNAIQLQLNNSMSIGGEFGPFSPHQNHVFQNQPSTDIRRRYDQVIERRRGPNFKAAGNNGMFGGFGSQPGILHPPAHSNNANPNHNNDPRYSAPPRTPFINASEPNGKPTRWNAGPQNQNEMNPKIQNLNQLQLVQQGPYSTNQVRFAPANPQIQIRSVLSPTGYAQVQTQQAGKGFLTFGRLDSVNKGTGLYQMGGHNGRQTFQTTQPMTRPQIGPQRDIANPLMLTGIRIGPRQN